MSDPNIVYAAPADWSLYPMDGAIVPQVKAWTRSAAGQDALTRNKSDYDGWLNGGAFTTWYNAYLRFQADEPCPNPPIAMVAYMSADGLAWDLIPDPAGSLCGPIPTYAKRPTPAASTPGVNPFAGLAGNSGTAGLLIGAVGAQVAQKDGTVWVRIK